VGFLKTDEPGLEKSPIDACGSDPTRLREVSELGSVRQTLL
jgi:hypothetical protein